MALERQIHDRSQTITRGGHLVAWRTGRKVNRNIYIVVGDAPSDDDILIGQMDTGALAREAVECHNARLRYDADG